MKKIYIDRANNKNSIGCVYAFFTDDTEVIGAGTTINSMSTKYKNEVYQKYSDDYDLSFIFDDDVPKVDYYTVPQVDIFAKDSKGGLFGTVGDMTDIKGSEPICYINNQKECYIVADNMKSFLNLIKTEDNWRDKMILNHDILFYSSKEEAQNELEFLEYKKDKKLFLTSSMGGCIKDNGMRIPCKFDNSNNFVDLLSKFIPVNPKCLIISSDPESIEINDSIKNLFNESFILSKIPLNKIDICDIRNESDLKNTIYDYNLLILAGGHVPTQNNFFNRIHLKELLKKYEGVIVGTSAGSMNCAKVVYAQPELDGEAIDTNYQRYLDGLDLTYINILPHFQKINDFLVDGLRPVEDISLPDSFIRPFYGLVDGSFILVEDDKSTLYGEAYYLENGNCKKVCELNQIIEL